MTTQIRSVSTQYHNSLKKALMACAVDLLRKYAPEGPPYDPFVIAQRLHVEVREMELAGIEGYIEIENGQYVASVSTSGPETRRRFTLAHELCHVLLMRKVDNGESVKLIRFLANGNLPGLHQDPVEESLCNYFAAELLMPSDEIRQRLLDQQIEPEAIFDIAKTYDVSTQSAAIQIVRVMRDRLICCSLWNLDSLWPLPVWWTGFKTTHQNEVRRLETLAERESDHLEVWQSYGGRRRPVEIRITTTPANRFAMMLIRKL